MGSCVSSKAELDSVSASGFHSSVNSFQVNDAGYYVNRTSKLKKTPVEDAVLPSPPFVNRQLKPHRPISGIGPATEIAGGSSSVDADNPSSRESSRSSQSNSVFDYENILLEQINSPAIATNQSLDSDFQYLDLDLESDFSLHSPKSPDCGPHHPMSHHEASSTVYTTIDFVKTEAFNRTRLKVEAGRYKNSH